MRVEGIWCLGFGLCKSKVDLALRCNVDMAMYLQHVWNGRPQMPPPSAASSYDSNRMWYQRNTWYRRDG